MRVLLLSNDGLTMDADIVQVETIEAARELIAASHFDVIITNDEHAEAMRASGVPVMLRRYAVSLEQVRRIAGIKDDPFDEIQRGIEEAKTLSAAGRARLADIFAAMNKPPQPRASGGKH